MSLVSAGGGLVPTARKPIKGADRLVAFLTTAYTRWSAEMAGTPVLLNGAPGARLAVVNPQKLGRLDDDVMLAR
jgi:hypothetical protein